MKQGTEEASKVIAPSEKSSAHINNPFL